MGEKSSQLPTAKNEQMEIHGTVARITFKNERNGHTVAKMEVSGVDGLITIVGKCPSIYRGEKLIVRGHWAHHTKFGLEFRVGSCEKRLPDTLEGMETYLGSGIIKGIGPVIAQRIIERFGLKAFEVMDSRIESLVEIEGIGTYRIALIRQAWQEYQEMRDLLVFLKTHGIGIATAIKINKECGRNAVQFITENPYSLIKIHGIGFLTADRIAMNLGIDRKSPLRINAGIVYVVSQFIDDGHVYCPYEDLIKRSSKILNVGIDVIRDAIEILVQERHLVFEEMTSNGTGNLIKAVYLPGLHVAESGVADCLRKMLAKPVRQLSLAPETMVRQTIDELNELGIILAPNQRNALIESVCRRVMVITGGPGTGKTTVIKSMVMLHKKLGRTILLAAPTGTAAKRMSNATGQEAKTLHRLLEFSPCIGEFRRNEHNPLNAEVIIVDESSMVDIALMYRLVKAIPPYASLILIGDSDQLPPVGPGNVLKDVIESGIVHTEKLHTIFRQEEGSLIIKNAHSIRDGHMPAYAIDISHNYDFWFLRMNESRRMLDTILHLCKEVLPLEFGYDPYNDVQVLTPMHKGIIGTDNLNSVLQQHLNPAGHELLFGEMSLKVGDKVMQTVNNYAKGVFNGDMGRIMEIDKEAQQVMVVYHNEKIVTYDYSDLDEITLAYAISVHKSQGSEYPVIMMPVSPEHFIVLQRNLIYTATTRAKKLVILLGSEKALRIALWDVRSGNRFTHLKQRLIYGSGLY